MCSRSTSCVITKAYSESKDKKGKEAKEGQDVALSSQRNGQKSGQKGRNRNNKKGERADQKRTCLGNSNTARGLGTAPAIAPAPNRAKGRTLGARPPANPKKSGRIPHTSKMKPLKAIWMALTARSWIPMSLQPFSMRLRWPMPQPEATKSGCPKLARPFEIPMTNSSYLSSSNQRS
jgi:hypothetical protein